MTVSVSRTETHAGRVALPLYFLMSHFEYTPCARRINVHKKDGTDGHTDGHQTDALRLPAM